MKKTLIVVSAVLGVLGILFGNAYGETYLNGTEGLKCATLPPPGFYYKMYNAYITSDALINNDGDEFFNFEMKSFASAQRFIWVFKDIKILGADYAVDIVIPVIYRDIKIKEPGVDESAWQLGDILLEPFDLAWHYDRYDGAAALGLFVPTGAHDDWADPGEDMYTVMLTLGGTYYFDEARTWTFSLLSRYEIHSRKRTGTASGDGDVKPGDDFHFEWGIGKTIDRIWDVGLVGYCQWQVEEDKGSGAPAGKDRGFSVGPEVSMFYPPWKTFFSLRSEWEFGVKGRSSGRPEGNRTFFVITKAF